MSQADDWVVRPERFVRYLRETKGLSASDVRLPSRGVIVFGGEDFRTLCKALHARVLRWNEWYGIGRRGKTHIVVIRTPIGAPATVLNFEEAIALGLRRTIAFGSCGSLVRDLPIGSVVLPSRAYADEGTSRHYGGERWSRPDSILAVRLRDACGRRGIPIREGGTWTTDAPYRESLRKVRYLAGRGVVAVDMEASALFQVARVRGARIASLFVVSDELDGPEWNAGFRDPRHLAAKRRAAGAVLEAIGGSAS